MNLQILTVGSPKGAYATLFDEYVKRLGRFHHVTVTPVRENKDAEATLLNKSAKTYRVVLDERGKELTTTELATLLERLAQQGKHPSFLIGGPDGHSDALRTQADMLWSLSRLVLPHDLAAVVTAEALYRAASVNAGHPYHRA